MIGQKSTLVRKQISDRHVHFGHSKVVSTNKVISQDTYTTNGEEFIVVKNVDKCIVTLDESTTENIKIKSLTNVLIKPKQGKIDEEYDEILINNRACVELFYFNGNWYITSSDGIKLD